MESTAIAVLGWTLAVLSAVTVLPQLLRLRSTGSSAGVSPISAALATVAMWAWCVYTAGIEDLPAFASSLSALLVWAAVLSVLLLRRRDRASAILGLVVCICMTLVSLSGMSVVFATTGSLLWILPQAVRSLRAGSLHALSVSAFLLVLAENVGWLVYALCTDRLAYTVAPLVQIPLSALIAWRARQDRTAADDVLPVPSEHCVLDTVVGAS